MNPDILVEPIREYPMPEQALPVTACQFAVGQRLTHNNHRRTVATIQCLRYKSVSPENRPRIGYKGKADRSLGSNPWCWVLRFEPIGPGDIELQPAAMGRRPYQLPGILGARLS